MRNDAKGREREDFEVTKPGDDSYMIFAAEREGNSAAKDRLQAQERRSGWFRFRALNKIEKEEIIIFVESKTGGQNRRKGVCFLLFFF